MPHGVSASPSRLPNGLSTDFPWGPLGDLGAPNPFKYNLWADDFQTLSYLVNSVVVSGAGTVVSGAGDGGIVVLTTAALAADFASFQVPNNFIFRPAIKAGKKMFFMARLKVSDAVNAAFIVGLVQRSATPMVVTDGIYFSKATGAANNLNVISMNASAPTTQAVPTSAYTLANDTYLDLAFYVNRAGEIQIFASADFWNKPSTEAKGPVASFKPAITTNGMTVGLTVQSGNAGAKTMTVDFALAAMER